GGNLVEARGQVVERIDEHRHAGGGQLRRQAPGLRSAADGDAHVAALRPAQQLADVGGSVHGHDDAAVAVQVTGQGLAPGGGEQGRVGTGRDPAAGLVHELV